MGARTLVRQGRAIPARSSRFYFGEETAGWARRRCMAPAPGPIIPSVFIRVSCGETWSRSRSKIEIEIRIGVRLIETPH